MPSQRSAIAALKKLEADREALDQRQRELEEKAAIELGQMLLGSGIETFSKKTIRKAGELLGSINNAPVMMRADQLTPNGTRLRYVQCPQAPFLDSNEQTPCGGK